MLTVLTERMKPQRATALFIALALCVIPAPGNPARSQTGSAEYSRQSDVIYGRKFGLALTMEVFTPAKPNGLGVVWVVSSTGKSSREQTLQPSFERRISPRLTHGYTIFAVIHGSSPAFPVADFVDDATRSARFVRHRASEFGIDGHRPASPAPPLPD
jgi:hypothetical protein